MTTVERPEPLLLRLVIEQNLVERGSAGAEQVRSPTPLMPGTDFDDLLLGRAYALGSEARDVAA